MPGFFSRLAIVLSRSARLSLILTCCATACRDSFGWRSQICAASAFHRAHLRLRSPCRTVLAELLLSRLLLKDFVGHLEVGTCENRPFIVRDRQGMEFGGEY